MIANDPYSVGLFNAFARTEAAEFQSNLQQTQASYFAGQTTRYLPQPSGVNPFGSGADYHYLNEREYFLMVERARQDDRDNMVFGQGINRFCSNVIPSPFQLSAKTDDDALNEYLEARWMEWSESYESDHGRERNFHESAKMALRTAVVDGDVFCIPLEDGSVQIVENHRVRSPHARRSQIRNGNGVVHGIELVNSRKVAAWFTEENLQPAQMVTERTNMRRHAFLDSNGQKQLWHLYPMVKRVSQRRGVTCAAPIIFPLRYHDDLQFAALVNAKRNSFFAMIHEFSPQQKPPPPRKDKQVGSRTEVTRADGTTQIEETGGPGKVYKAAPGETIKGYAPDLPSTNFFEHAAMLLRIVGINLDLPEMIFMLDARHGNFSNYRGVFDQAKQRMMEIQQYMANHLYAEVYRWKALSWAMEDLTVRRAFNRLGSEGFYKHEWTPPVWPYLEPVKDITADTLEVGNNLISPSRRAKRRNLRWETLTDEIVSDRGMLIEKAILQARKLNQLDKDANVNWRDIAYGNTDGVRVSLSGQIDEQPESQPQAESENEPQPATR